MNKLTKYKKKKLSRTNKLIISIILLLLTIGVGYSALVSNLSISGNLLVKKYEEPVQVIPFSDILEDLKTNNSTCFTKYEGQVTDQPNQTVTASNVYFNKCADKRNIKFAGYCWQMIRTTETGGVKMIYNGEPDNNGECGSSRSDHKGIVQSNYTDQTLSSSYLYGSSFIYDNTNFNFILTDTETETWSDSTYEDLIGKFTCMSSSDTCENIYQINGYKSNTEGYASAYKISATNHAQIGTSSYNANYRSPAMVGYMFNKVYNVISAAPTSGSLMGNDVSYSNGTYTLLPASGESTLGTSMNDTHHYTCNNTTGTCNKVRYYYYSSGSYNYYIELNGETNIDEAVNNMLYNDNVNRYNSSIKGIIDAWYAQNLLSKTNMLEDTVYCSSRDMSNQSTNGWNKDESLTIYINFKNDALNRYLSCASVTDQFSVGNSKAKLTYPVALATAEDLYTLTNNNNSTYYSVLTSTGAWYWNLSPSNFNRWSADVRVVGANGPVSYSIDGVRGEGGVRPVVTLSSGATISRGTGSESDPFIIQE